MLELYVIKIVNKIKKLKQEAKRQKQVTVELFFCPICKQATTTRKTVTISIYETRKKVLQVILIWKN
jgi:hypothetical protein